MIPIRPRHRKVLDFCHSYAKTHGWAASDGEIAEAVGMSKASVKYALHKLDKTGFIEYVGSRQYKVLYLP